MASSKWNCVKGLLSGVNDGTVIRIADELELIIPKSENLGSIKLAEILNGSAYIHAKKDFEKAILDIDKQPENAIGMACTTLESICKAILDSFGEPYPNDESLQPLQKAVFEKPNLSPNRQADPDIKRILGGLINVGAGLATLRTRYSSFHGKGAKQYRLGKRHARLAVNSLSTIGLFLLETLEDQFINHEDSSK